MVRDRDIKWTGPSNITPGRYLVAHVKRGEFPFIVTEVIPAFAQDAKRAYLWDWVKGYHATKGGEELVIRSDMAAWLRVNEEAEA